MLDRDGSIIEDGQCRHHDDSLPFVAFLSCILRSGLQTLLLLSSGIYKSAIIGERGNLVGPKVDIEQLLSMSPAILSPFASTSEMEQVTTLPVSSPIKVFESDPGSPLM